MKKEEAVNIITSCAKQYNKNLENKTFLFVYNENKSDKTVKLLETIFLPRNFLHLTGVKILNSDVNSSDFYKRCLAGQLSPSVFDFYENGTTEMKLSVLPQIMNIHKVARMLGDYSSAKAVLMTEKIVGTITACLGFVYDGKFYIPNTVLKEDIRDITTVPQKRVLAIFQKEIKEQYYSYHTYLAKGITLDSLLSNKGLKSKICVHNAERD